jgi:hypothetical protein
MAWTRISATASPHVPGGEKVGHWSGGVMLLRVA